MLSKAKQGRACPATHTSHGPDEFLRYATNPPFHSIALAYLFDADPVVAAQAQGLHLQPSRLVGVDLETLVAVGRAAGLDLLREAAAGGDLELADALVPLEERNVEEDDILRLVEIVGDIALFILQSLAAAPAGVVARVPVARKIGGAAARVTAPVRGGAGIVGASLLGDGGPPPRIDEGWIDCSFIRVEVA